MARPQQKGLLYFPFDVTLFEDKKIKILKAKHGMNGVMLYIYLLCEVYKNGYYVQLDKDYEYLISSELNMSAGEIKQVIKFLLERSLFDYKLFQSDNVITSPGIQRRFQEAIKEKAKKNPRQIVDNFWLLPEEETQSFIKVTHFQNYSRNNSDYSENNSDYSKNNDTKEKKVKESKEKKNISKISSELNSEPPIFELILNDKTLFPVFKTDIDSWTELYPAVDVMQEIRKMIGWLDSNPQKRKTKSGIRRFINSWLARTQDQGGNISKFCNSNSKQFKTSKEKSYEAMQEFLDN